jgi:hypothetical protein
MSELAFNLNGEPFDVPPTMAAWRVRKLKPKGAPEVVYGRDGLPLFLPMDADIEDLRREARGEGRYRLDPVDDHNRAVANAQASYVCVHPVERTPELAAHVAAAPGIQADTTAQLVNALLESQKQHTELARMYVSQFPVLVNALSGVVRSAGDAGLPARVPLLVPVAPEAKPAEPTGGAKDDEDEDDEDDDEDDDDDDDDEVEAQEEAGPEAEWNWARFAATALDKFSPQIDALVGQLPALSATLGGKRAKRAADEPRESAGEESVADVGAHLNAIRAALTADEAATVMALADELSMTDKLLYFQKLRGMPVPEAVAYLRGELAKLAHNSARGAAGAQSDEETEPGRAMSDVEIDAHINAICAAMTPEESETVRVMFEELISEHRLMWVEKVRRMSVPDGVAFFRKQLAEAQRDARAHGATEPRIAPPSALPVPPSAPSSSTTARPRLDGRRVAVSPPPSESPWAKPTVAAGGAPTNGLGMVSPATQAHITAIQNALTADEDTAMRAHVAALSHTDRSPWIATLLMLPVPEAVAMIRAQLAVDRARAAQPDDATATGPLDAASTAPGAALRNLAALTSTPPRPASVEVTAPHEGLFAPALAPATSARPVTVPAGVPVAAAATLPAAAPQVIATNAETHLLAIESALTAGERFLLHAAIAQLPPHARGVWRDKLLSVSVTEGTAILRVAIQELTAQALPIETRTGGARDTSGHAPGDGWDLDDGQELDREPEREPGEEYLDDEEPDGGQDLIDSPVASSASERGAAPTAPAPVPSAGLPTLDPEALTHFKAIEGTLTFAERLRVFELGAQLPGSELRAWITELTALPVPDAIVKVRAALAAAEGTSRKATSGGVS